MNPESLELEAQSEAPKLLQKPEVGEVVQLARAEAGQVFLFGYVDPSTGKFEPDISEKVFKVEDNNLPEAGTQCIEVDPESFANIPSASSTIYGKFNDIKILGTALKLNK